MRIKWKPLFISLAVPLTVGGISAFLTKDSMGEFTLLRRPPLSPPMWVFPVVWTILFAVMGFASYLVYTAEGRRGGKRSALWTYGLQLLVNFAWPVFFFELNWRLFAFFWLILLWAMILGVTVQFFRIRPGAGLLMLPYLAWVAFAGYLNFGIYLLN